MDHEENQGLLQSFLGLFARRGPERSIQSTSVQSQATDAWMRADAFLQHEDNGAGGRDPEQVKRALRALDNLLEPEHSREADSLADTWLEQTTHKNLPYSNLRRAVYNADTDSRPTIRISKRKRESDDAMEALEDLDNDAKKRRVVVREDPVVDDDTFEPDAEEAIEMRKRSMSLHQGLQNHWMCVCHKCSGLSVRLSLPQRRTSSKGETCFDVFFGVQDPIEKHSLQEAKITVKYEFEALMG
ncbi:hypothetical protein LTR86_009170 [Recurvomyces mirabilis]|nr:hypothetical protein LTR86_009170 [Recurvomyces mirabilis]